MTNQGHSSFQASSGYQLMAGYQIQSRAAQSNILEALNFIVCNSDFASLAEEEYPGLTSNQRGSLLSAYSKLKSDNPSKWHFEVPQLEIPVLDEKLRSQHPTALVGGITEAEGGEVTYSSLSICITFTTETGTADSGAITDTSSGLNLCSCCLPACENRKRIVRRFHFDHQPDESNKPPSHIQYGGVFPENNTTLGWHYCLEHFLENPRLHYLPMDLVLLLDLVTREFNTPLRKWTHELAWTNLVLKSQNIWWSEYWDWIARHLSRHNGPTFHQTIYGQQ